MMLEDISAYKDTRRNEKCPCGSGKIFKKCCMKEYREMKKQGAGSGAKISAYSPLPPIALKDKEIFTEFYTRIMIFSHQYRNKSETVMIDDAEENLEQFIRKERDYFYENCEAIIEKYLLEEDPTEEEKEILNSLKSAIFDDFFLVTKSKETAVVVSKSAKLYNIRALHSPFDEVFNQREKYLMIRTALMPYKDGYIVDGIFNAALVPKEIEEYLDKLPYQNPQIIYSKEEDRINIQFALSFSIGCSVENFKEMEEILLKNIPKDFAQGMLELFENDFDYSPNIISSMVRTTDFLELMEDKEKGHKTLDMIFGGLPVMNFEKGGSDGVIPYELLEKLYKQAPIEKSISFDAYKRAKDTNKPIFLPKLFSSFYTMLGITNIKQKDYERFSEFIETFKNRDKREMIADGIENLCEEFSETYDFEIFPVFIDAAVELEEIRNQLSEYHQFMQKEAIPSIKAAQSYSRNRS